MFGADTPLVMDALQIAAAVAVAAGGAVYLLMHQKRRAAPTPTTPIEDHGDLEERVRVLERIATDRSIDLADEIEALRDPAARKAEVLDGGNS